jgi:archaellum biogenesis protein FlaJ (TadC family)
MRAKVFSLASSTAIVVLIALLTALFKLPHYLALPAIAIAMAVLWHNPLTQRYEAYVRNAMISSLLVAGRGLRSRELRLLSSVLKLVQALALAFAFLTAMHMLFIGFNALLLILTVVTPCFLFLLLQLPKVLIYSWASQRRTAVEVELPYLVIMLRCLSTLRMPIYDIISIIESSVALPASAREIRFARKIATVTGTSLLGALDLVYLRHPSERVANLLRRVIIAAVTMGDYSDVAEKVFDALYGWFEARVSRLVGSFTMIVGSSLFVYLFVPVIIAAVAPVMPDSLLPVLGISLALQVLIFFMLSALILSLYPSSIVIKPSKRLKIASMAALLAAAGVVLFNVFSIVAGKSPLPELLSLALVVAFVCTALVLSEVELRRAYFYDTFVRIASDALSIAATTGENPVTVLERVAHRYGRRAVRLSRTIATGYLSESLRRGVVGRAPSIFHASFLEALINILRLGATPAMLKTFTASYERLSTQVSRVRGFAKTLEAVMAGLVAVVGGFLAYIDKVFNSIVKIIQSATSGAGVSIPLPIPFTYEPKIYALLSNLSILSLLLISIFISYVRGGSHTYSFRPFLITLVLYFIFKSIISIAFHYTP